MLPRRLLAALALIALTLPAQADFLADLTSKDEDVRRAAADRLPDRYLRPEDVPKLIAIAEAALARERSPILARVVREIGSFGPDAAAAVPVLLRVAKPRPGNWARAEAVRALGEIGEAARPAVPLLVDLVEEANERYLVDWRRTDRWPGRHLARNAAVALGRIGDVPDAVPALANAVRLWPVNRRCAAIRALGRLGEPAKAAIPILAEALDQAGPPDPFSPDPRPAAAEALSRLGPDAVRPLAGRVLSDSWVTRTWVLEALDRMGTQAAPAIGPLYSLLCIEEDESRRVRAVEVLRRVGAGPEVFLDLLRDRDPLVRRAAAVALAEVAPGSEEAVRELVLAVEDRRLGLYGKESPVDDAIVSFGELAVPYLVQAMTREYEPGYTWTPRTSIPPVLGRIDELAPLEKLLAHEDEDIVELAFRAIRWLGPKAKPAIPAIARLLDAENPNLANGAARFLGRLGPVSLPEIEKVRASRPPTGWDGCRQRAEEAIAAIRTEAAMARRAPPLGPDPGFRPAFAPGEAKVALFEHDLVLWRTEGTAEPDHARPVLRRGAAFTLHVQRLDGSPLRSVPVREMLRGLTVIGPVLDDDTIGMWWRDRIGWIAPEALIDRRRLTLDGEEAEVLAAYRDGLVLRGGGADGGAPVWFVPLDGRDLVPGRKVRFDTDRLRRDYDSLVVRDGYRFRIESGFPGRQVLRVIDLEAEEPLEWTAAEFATVAKEDVFWTDAGITIPGADSWRTVPWPTR